MRGEARRRRTAQRDGTRLARNRCRVLVGYGSSDDAGVYLLREDLALVQTVDFFHADRRRPVRFRPHRGNQCALRRLCDGRHAASARSTSSPFPRISISRSSRASSKAARPSRARPASQSSAATPSKTPSRNTAWPLPASSIRGGSSPTRRAKPGDVLVLTKPLGTGILTTALKRGAIAATRSGRSRCAG